MASTTALVLGAPRPTANRSAGRSSGVRALAALKNIEVNTPAQKQKAILRPPQPKSAAPKLLTRIEALRLLSKVEEAGLLSLAEKAGFTLSTIESLGLLSKAESLGALSLATDRNTPTALTLTGLALFGAAAGVVVAVPDTDSTLLIAQGAGAVLLGGAGLAALVAGSVLGDLQRS